MEQDRGSEILKVTVNLRDINLGAALTYTYDAYKGLLVLTKIWWLKFAN